MCQFQSVEFSIPGPESHLQLPGWLGCDLSLPFRWNPLATVLHKLMCLFLLRSEAEKQEEAAENAENDLGGEDGLNVRNSAIITINAQVRGGGPQGHVSLF